MVRDNVGTKRRPCECNFFIDQSVPVCHLYGTASHLSWTKSGDVRQRGKSKDHLRMPPPPLYWQCASSYTVEDLMFHGDHWEHQRPVCIVHCRKCLRRWIAPRRHKVLPLRLLMGGHRRGRPAPWVRTKTITLDHHSHGRSRGEHRHLTFQILIFTFECS